MSFLDTITNAIGLGDESASTEAAQTGTGNTTFWDGLVDDFSTIAEAAIKYEEAKNPANEGVQQTTQVTNTPISHEPNPQQTPANALEFQNVYTTVPVATNSSQNTLLSDDNIKIGIAALLGLIVAKAVL